MKTYFLNNLSAEEIKNLVKRPSSDVQDVSEIVKAVLQKVQENEDTALKEYALRFDGVKMNDFKVSEQEFIDAEKSLTPEIKNAIQIAAQNIQKFHSAQLQQEAPVEIMPGVMCFRESRAIEKVGLYVPGGTAPLFSTVLMLAIPARIAGCKNIILCTPPNKRGNIAPEILFATKANGVTEIYKVGGAQAIAAMAYGTESISKVDKIFGPGNQYVTAAKMLISIDPNGSAIDMPAGPSEVLVIADGDSNPAFIAADLLSQAEHGEDSQVVLMLTDEQLAAQVQSEMKKQLQALPRRSIAEAALQNSLILITDTIEESFDFSNQYAPEHLILSLQNSRKYLPLIRNAGSVFLGPYSPESVGDYASGTNHTLPTSGYARSYSGISVESFLRKITFQELTEEGLKNISQTVITMAEAEELQAHADAVKIRL